ncbi:hypothetical protein B0H14DRAFT_3864219 [Mycena olivaceomarginata]|nr:hypothetical protein B0H14DRAFT_3864219 [Mycena olivaceomarginata]
MPVIKSKAKAKNLGAYSVKASKPSSKMKDHLESVPEPLPRHPEPYGEDASESDGEDDPGVDVHEENDIPHPKDYTDLVQWLKLSDEHLASFHTSAAPAQRGSYHSTKVSQGVSVRRAQELRKAEKERAEREQKEDSFGSRVGKFVSAKDIVRYVATPEFQARLRIKRKISIRTAQRWMKKMGYRWRREPKGMYSDGHEREDVVHYRQNVFLPRWREFESRSRWYKDGLTDDQVTLMLE